MALAAGRLPDAAEEITVRQYKKQIHGKPIAEIVSFVPVPRDDSQSMAENRIRMDHAELLKFNRDLKAANDNGPVKNTMVENMGGAQCQIDVFCGRDPIETIIESVRPLDPGIGVRPLIRGSNGVGLKVLHPDDLERVLRLIAEAAGANTGRLVTFKLFEAQNRPEDLVPALKILTKLRKEGYAIECELAVCYTAHEVYDGKYYEDKTYDFLKNLTRHGEEIDPGLVTAIGIKDMIGMLLGGEGEISDGNSAETTNACLRGIEKFMREDGKRPMTFCLHNHNTGHAAEALAAAIAAFLARKEELRPDSFMADMKMRGDYIPDGTSFASQDEVDRRLKEQHGYDLGFSEEQSAFFPKWKNIFSELKRFYSYCLIKQDLLSDRQKRFAFIAGGALGSDDRMAMEPLVKTLKDYLTKQGKQIDEKACKSIIKALFINVRRQLFFDNGYPHSVTPAANNLSMSAKEVIDGMIRDGFVKQMMDRDVDLEAIGESKDLSKRLEEKWIEQFHKYYGHIRHPASMEYFRRMPRPIHPVLRAHYDKAHLNKVFADKSVLNDIVAADKLESVQAALLRNPSDKAAAAELLASYDAGHEERVREFIAGDIGNNELPADHGVKPFGDEVERKARQCQSEGKLKISLEGAIFSALNMGLDRFGNLPAEIVKLWETPVKIAPLKWINFFFDKWGKTHKQIEQYERAKSSNGHGENGGPKSTEEWRRTLQGQATLLMGGFPEGHWPAADTGLLFLAFN